ncbi:MAG: hypothetical protein D6737_16940 [Chloroflexi bacterium]|nr:MAG: hypothetical protein D6737_16940 [Chloroflexota bacterium]
MQLPTMSRRLRMATLLYGMIVFFWLTPEEDSVVTVTILGVVAAFLMAWWQLLRWRGGHAVRARLVPLMLAVFGALVGILAGGATAFLMLMKNAIHGHENLDYRPELMLAILERVPVWALAGALLGLGFGLAWLALRENPRPY